MQYVLAVLKAFGSTVDTIVPFLVGSRTKLAVVLCPLLHTVAPFVPVTYQPAVQFASVVLCTAAPVLALAGLVRTA